MAIGQRELYEEVAELYEDVVLDAVVTEYDLWEREVDRGAEPSPAPPPTGRGHSRGHAQARWRGHPHPAGVVAAVSPRQPTSRACTLHGRIFAELLGSRGTLSRIGFLLRPSVNAASGAAVTQGEHHGQVLVLRRVWRREP